MGVTVVALDDFSKIAVILELVELTCNVFVTLCYKTEVYDNKPL